MDLGALLHDADSSVVLDAAGGQQPVPQLGELRQSLRGERCLKSGARARHDRLGGPRGVCRRRRRYGPERVYLRAPIALCLGRWLQQVRVSKGMSQERVAITAELAVSTYGRLERSVTGGDWANPTLETFLRVLVALEVDPADLEQLVTELGRMAHLQ